MLQLLNIINGLFEAYTLVLIVYALMSWFPGARESKLGEIINRLSRPYLDIFDRLIPSVGGIGFSVIVGVLVLQLAQRGINSILLGLLF